MFAAGSPVRKFTGQSAMSQNRVGQVHTGAFSWEESQLREKGWVKLSSSATLQSPGLDRPSVLLRTRPSLEPPPPIPPQVAPLGLWMPCCV